MAPPPSFDPDAFFERWTDEDFVPSHENGFSFRDCITRAFNLPSEDDYVYRAQGATTLELTQRAINGKRAHGLHGWYHDENGDETYPTPQEITSYTSLFSPHLSLPKALNSYKSTRKPGTLSSQTAAHLTSLYHPPSKTLPQGLLPPTKSTRTHKNPYHSLWTYTCHELEYSGPTPRTADIKISHHTLPILYHHFGCIVPSYTALHVLAKLAQPARPSREPVRPILDVGSGNGYWTYMLRRFERPDGGWKELVVHAVDNATSEYRMMWIGDTIVEDGVRFLGEGRVGDWRVDGGKEAILLLVYPQATGGFTGSVLRAYKGDTIVVAGTQNRNGFTGFKDCVVDEWVERELGEFELVLRMPLPSFAGKDEALFVFQRRT